jgi:hypothetical protein
MYEVATLHWQITTSLLLSMQNKNFKQLLKEDNR